MTRILHLSWEYPPVMYGGLGRHVHALAEAQAARGDDVVVITQSAPGTSPDEVVNGVRVIRVRLDAPDVPDWRVRFIEWTFGFNVAVARAAMAVTRSWRPDVVHGHDWLVAQAAVLVQESMRLRLVMTVHATEFGRVAGRLASELSQAVDSTERWVVGLADEVIVCSGFMRDEVTGVLGADPARVTVIPNGIDPAAWRSSPARRRAMRRQWGTPLIAYAGRLEPEKGVQTLIDAMRSVRRSQASARAVVVGEGGAELDLKARVRRRRLSDAVSFAGHVSEADLRAIVAAADVAVVPSLYEPFGFVALEAMVLGAPLVVSQTGGLAEIVLDGHTGWHFPPGDSEALADTIVDVLDRRGEARRRAAAARQHVVAVYGWTAIAERTDTVYGTRARRPRRDSAATG